MNKLLDQSTHRRDAETGRRVRSLLRGGTSALESRHDPSSAHSCERHDSADGVDAMRCRPMRQPLACWTLHGRHEGPPICVLASHPNRERARMRRTLFFVSPCCVARLRALHRSCAEPATNCGRAARATSAGAVNNAPQGHVDHAAEPWSRAHAKWLASSRPSQRSAPPTVRARTRDRPTVVGSMGEAIDDRSLHRDAYSGRYVSGRTQR
jgi:hypothetical protein